MRDSPLNLTDAEVDAILADVLGYESDQPAGRHYAEFTLKFNDVDAPNGRVIPGREYHVKAWADLTSAQVCEYLALVGNP